MEPMKISVNVACKATGTRSFKMRLTSLTIDNGAMSLVFNRRRVPVDTIITGLELRVGSWEHVIQVSPTTLRAGDSYVTSVVLDFEDMK